MFVGEVTDVSVTGFVLSHGHRKQRMVVRSKTFFTADYFQIEGNQKVSQMPWPDTVILSGMFQDRFILRLRASWQVADQELKAGDVVAVTSDLSKVSVLYSPTEKSSVVRILVTKSNVIISLLDNVVSRLIAFFPVGENFGEREIELPTMGSISLLGGTVFDETIVAAFESFLIPPSIYRFDAIKKTNEFVRQHLRSQHSRFDEAQFETKQLEAFSFDGTVVPYFVVHRKGLILNGDHPTLLYGYGGFELSMTPSYNAIHGKTWLERGGVFVLANIRGGGEFGPTWHQAALKENRQHAFDDFIAVSENLVQRHYTSPRRLGIMGGSNGGLLVGAVTTQRPELFSAVICQVPLLDMLRYHLLLAGASWMGEYGDPEDPTMREIINCYSPYQKLDSAKVFPPIFFLTSTKDDRVHPGHARKMAARMEELGHPYLYYENTEGGHGGSSNIDQDVRQRTMQGIYLIQRLMD